MNRRSWLKSLIAGFCALIGYPLVNKLQQPTVFTWVVTPNGDKRVPYTGLQAKLDLKHQKPGGKYRSIYRWVQDGVPQTEHFYSLDFLPDNPCQKV